MLAEARRLGESVKDDMKLLGLQPEWAVFRDMWKDLIWGKHLFYFINFDTFIIYSDFD